MTLKQQVFEVMRDGQWRTGLQIAQHLGAVYTDGIMSALRKLRQKHTVKQIFDPKASKRTGRRIHRYRLIPHIPGK